MLCAALLVLLVPSPAWSDGTGESPSSSPSSEPPSSPPPSQETEPPPPDSSSDSSSPPPSSEPSSEPPPSSPEPSSDSLEEEPELLLQEEVVEEPEPCGTEEKPCLVALPLDLTAALLLAAGLSVTALIALLVTSWGRD